MAEPYLAEIRTFSFHFPPKGWAQCDGQVLPINQNQALFALLGTTYGGNGQTTFALPDLRGRSPLHPNQQYPLGTTTGQTAVTLSVQNLPSHTHQLRASTANASSRITTGGVLAAPEGNPIYTDAGPQVPLTGAVSIAGQSLPVNIEQPYLVINYCIALQGIFPSQN